MLGNITLVQPIERLYNSAFQKQWEATLAKVRLTSPGDLEELDRLIKRLEQIYAISGIRKLTTSLGTYPDEYAARIRSLKTDMQETIARKFRIMEQQISKMVGDPESIYDFDAERKRFDDALSSFRVLRAFYKRWKLYADDYHYPGERYSFDEAMKSTAYLLAKKRMLLMKEYSSMKKVVDYKAKLEVLDEISVEVSKLFDWYRSNYLNQDSRNASWIGAEHPDSATEWMPVDFLEDDLGIAPLERFRKVPSSEELQDVKRLFDHFVEFYRQHELVGLNELGVLSDYARFRDYSANFSLYSEDSEERLKAGLMEQMLSLHKTYRDADERISLKRHTERLFESSFGMYFAPIDEIYTILRQGYISPESSIGVKLSDSRHGSLVFNVDADIKDGDVGFIFPLTKLLTDHLFYQVSYSPLTKEGLSESNTCLHIFPKDAGSQLRIDIRQGIFIAPKNRMMRYSIAGQPVRESSEAYFRRFFSTLDSTNSGWFDHARLKSWLSRHCVFYDDVTRTELLNMLRNKSFVSVMNRFTNRSYDNLSLAQMPGSLRPSEFYVTHRFEDLPSDRKEVLKSDTFNVTLFEWVTE